MSRSLSSSSTLEALRKEARQWLAALRGGDAAAHSRLIAVSPDAPAEPTLLDVQLALAREHGLPGWQSLPAAIETLAQERRSQVERAEILLRSAWDGGSREAAQRVLERWPSLAHFDLGTAVVTGQLAEVQRRLATWPDSATRKRGSLGWQPLQYLAYARLSGDGADDVAIASLLLDEGADPDASFDDGWGNAFTVLTGVIGEGEGDRLPHPRARELAQLLIESGADPFDTQALYNTSITRDDPQWLEFLWAHCGPRGRQPPWSEVNPKSIGGNVNLSPLDYLLGNAVAHGHLRRAEWLLQHGAHATAVHAYSGRPLRDEALLHFKPEMARLLERHGAPANAMEEKTAFKIACLNLDRVTARELAARHPEFLQDAEPMLMAARAGHVDTVALLLELGMPVDIADGSDTRAMHAAAGAGALAVLKLLVEKGADIDRPTKHYGGPLGTAAYFGQREIAEYLAPLSRDINPITYFNLQDRLRELLDAEPALVNAVHPRTGNTPLATLPNESEKAVAMAGFLLARGANPKLRNNDGLTPEEFLRKRGLFDAADLIATSELK